MSPMFTFMSHGAGVKGADTILENDPLGLTVTLISVIVVLSALILLGVLIWGFSEAMIYSEQRQAELSRKKLSNAKAGITCVEEQQNGEIIAAISLALKLHKEALHDNESKVITINTVARVYSPWSSKIHGLTNLPR